MQYAHSGWFLLCTTTHKGTTFPRVTSIIPRLPLSALQDSPSSLHSELSRLWFRAPLKTPSLGFWSLPKICSLTLPDSLWQTLTNPQKWNTSPYYLLPYQGDADRVSIQTDWQWPRNQTTSFSLPPRDHWCKLPPPLIILKQGCCFTQMLPLTVTPCIPSEIYPCSTRSAMGVDGVMKVLKTPRPVIIVAEQIIHWKRLTPFRQ